MVGTLLLLATEPVVSDALNVQQFLAGSAYVASADVALAQTSPVLAPGATVQQVVSTVPRVITPDVRRQTEQEAQGWLARSGFSTLPVGTQYDPEIPLGQVVKQLPPSGAAMPGHSTIQLVLSAGPAPKSSITPEEDAMHQTDPHSYSNTPR